jgi:hypothetical protein
MLHERQSTAVTQDARVRDGVEKDNDIHAAWWYRGHHGSTPVVSTGSRIIRWLLCNRRCGSPYWSELQRFGVPLGYRYGRMTVSASVSLTTYGSQRIRPVQ